MRETYYTVRRSLAGCTVDYPRRCRTRAEAEAYAVEVRRYCVGGTVSIVPHEASLTWYAST